MRENDHTVMISMRLPRDIFDKLPKPPPGKRNSKVGEGRSATIAAMLRWAINEKAKQAEAGSRPAEAKA
jgi:hypothetical protein